MTCILLAFAQTVRRAALVQSSSSSIWMSASALLGQGADTFLKAHLEQTTKAMLTTCGPVGVESIASPDTEMSLTNC